MSDYLFGDALTELYGVQFCDNTSEQAKAARREVEQIIRKLADEAIRLRERLTLTPERIETAEEAK